MRLILKNAIVLAFFSCGCNQSQIFPRSGGKYTTPVLKYKRVVWIFSSTRQFLKNAFQVLLLFCKHQQC